MPDNAQFVIRNFQMDQDLARLALFRLELRGEEIDPAKLAREEAETRTQIEQRRNHNPALDRWVVTPLDNPQQIIAHANVWAQTPARNYGSIQVSPAWRRRGIGSALLTRQCERSREQGIAELVLGAALDNPAGQAFLQQHGLSVAGHTRDLQAPAAVIIPQPVWPSGFSVRSYAEVQDIHLLVALQQACYGNMWGHMENTPGAITAAVLQQFMTESPHVFIQDGIFIVFAPNGEAVGVCHGRVGAETTGGQAKTVDSPGVVAAYQHLGLHRPLVLTTMQWLRQSYGPGPIQMETYGDSDEAIAIYQELGFVLEPSQHWVDYCLSVQ
jgi:mycothiol synthase